MKSLPRSPWEAASRKRPRPPPSKQTQRLPKDAGVIDLTGDSCNSSGVTVASSSESATSPQQWPSRPPSSPAIESKPTGEGGDQPRSIYLRHFEGAIEFVVFSRPDYALLFTSEERMVAHRFLQLSPGAKSLYVRLFQRKGPWFRIDGMLGYDEVGSGTPLWIRRRDAAAAASSEALDVASAGGIATAGVDGERHDWPLNSLPLNPFGSQHDEEASTASNNFVDGTAARFKESHGASRAESATDIEIARDELDASKVVAANGASTSTAQVPAKLSEKSQPSSKAAGAAPVKLTPRELTVLHRDIQSCLHELVNAGFLDGLPIDVWGKSSGLDVVLASLECCLKSVEVKTLLTRTGGVKSSARAQGTKAVGRASLHRGGGQNGGADGGLKHLPRGGDLVRRRSPGRQVMIEELRRRLAGQQTLWGAKLPLVREIERLVISSLKDLGVDLSPGPWCGYDSNDGERANDTEKRRRHFLVRAADIPQVVFKRALRLMYLTSNTGALSSGRVGAASVRGPEVAGAMSSWSPGLAVAFGKTRYAQYVCNPRTRIFKGRDHFLRWEAAVELRCALDGATAELSRGWREAVASAGMGGNEEEEEGGIERSLGRGLPQVLAPGDGEREPDGVRVKGEVVHNRLLLEAGGGLCPALDGLQESVAQFLLGDRGQSATRPGQTVPTATCPAVAITVLCSLCLHAHLGTSSVILASVSNRVKREARDFESREEEGFLSLLGKAWRGGDKSGCARQPLNANDATERGTKNLTGGASSDAGLSTSGHQEHLLPRSELRSGDDQGLPRRGIEGKCSYYEPSLCPTEDDIPLRGGVDSRQHDEINTGLQVPEFLLQLDAGWVLASAVWDGVSLLEKCRDYERAVELLAQLLSTRYTPHRRGRWWMRLSLDLAHAGRDRSALWAAEEGTWDPQVLGGDRLALVKRVAMLTKRSSKSLKRSSVARSSSGSGETATVSSPARPHTPPSIRGVGGPPKQEASLSILSSPPNSDFSPPEKKVGDAPNALGGACDDGDELDIFQDPSIERERLRRQRRRRVQRQRKLDEEQLTAEGSGEKMIKRPRGSCSLPPRARAERQKTKEETAVAAAGSSSFPTCNDTGAVYRRLKIGGSPRTGDSGETLDIDGSDDGNRNGLRAKAFKPAAPAVMVTVAPEVAAAAASVKKLELEGLAKLLQIRNLLDDDSVVAAVLDASAMAKAGTEDYAGGCVSEMSITGRRLNREVGVKSRFVGYDDSTSCSVESLVLQHLSQQEEGSWAGWHCEGSPVRGLWALLMWDVIFADVPDVFQTPFQDAPLDLDYCPLFYVNRRVAVDARLAEIRASTPGALIALVADAWRAHTNTVCRGLRWEGTSVRYLQVTAAGLGGRALAAAFAALCLNHNHFAGGLPDLLLMRAVRMGAGDDSPVGGDLPPPPGSAAAVTTGIEVSTPTRFSSWLGIDLGASDANRALGDHGARAGSDSVTTRARHPALPPRSPLKSEDIKGFRVDVWLLEVKGPGDRLSDRQTAWLRILDHGGARVGVCRVTEGRGGSHVTRTATI